MAEPYTVIQTRRDTEANWNANDPVLALGEQGYDTTNNKIKVGDGVTEWTGLDYVEGSGSGFSGSYDDLTSKPTIGDGKITLVQAGETVGEFTVNQEGDQTITLSEAPPVDPPVKTQDPEISSDNNYTTEPLTVTKNAIVTNATKASETWVKDGSDLNVGGNSYTPTDEGSYSFKEVFTGDDGSTVEATSNALTIEDQPPGPTATMSGLRFDSDRSTALTRSLTGSPTCTMSVWAKPGKQTGANAGWLFAFAPGTAAGPNLLNADNTLRFNDGATHHVIGPKLAENVWAHIVLTSIDNKVTCYVNGELTGTANVAANSTKLERATVGWHTNNHYNGYLSDFYFVEGKVAPPTTFGKSFVGGKWGPLDSAVVQDNLDNLQPADPTPEPGPGDLADQPYDSRANTDEVWSAGATGPWNLGDATTAYDGSLVYNDAPQYASGQDIVVFSGSIAVNKAIAVNTWFTGTGTSVIKVEGSAGNVTQEFALGGSSSSFYEVPYTGTVTAIKINIGSSTSRFVGLKIDGRVLVDQGVWDNSQNWSDGTSYR